MITQREQLGASKSSSSLAVRPLGLGVNAANNPSNRFETEPRGTTQYPLYGALELKRSYQHNFSWGIIIAVIAHVAAIEGWIVYRWLRADPQPVSVREIVLRSLSELASPPSIVASKPLPKIADPSIQPPSIGIPTPVPDEEVTETVHFATREELAQLSAPAMTIDHNAAGNGDSVVITISSDEYFPPPEEFVAVQDMPVLIKEAIPVYPELARLTGLEGKVWVRVLVDRSGKVRDARLAKTSGSAAGFDDAALQAAYKNLYKPAIQNGQPVAVWVTYPVEFVLE